MLDPSKFSGIQWAIVPFIIFLRYFIMAGAAFFIFYVWKRRDWIYRKIQEQFPRGADYRREITYSAITSFIFGFSVWLCIGTPFREYTQYYSDIHAYSLTWFWISIGLTVIIHDTYFYWAHRFMHLPVIYRKVHLTHHRSVNPSPWAAFAFHPLEALVEAGIIPILFLVMPLHPYAFLGFVFIMLLFNVYGHLGYELFPKSSYRNPLGKWINSGVYHNLHHERFTGNYGLYFTFWDKICGTLRTDSAEKVEIIHNRIQSNK